MRADAAAALREGPHAICAAYFVTHPRERRRANEQVTKLEAEKRAIENKIPTTMVMQEMAKPRDTFVLMRGSYDKPGEKVTAGGARVPAAAARRARPPTAWDWRAGWWTRRIR